MPFSSFINIKVACANKKVTIFFKIIRICGEKATENSEK